MKKIVSIATSAIILLTITGCSNQKNNTSNSSSKKDTSSQSEIISDKSSSESTSSTSNKANSSNESTLTSTTSEQDFDIDAINNGDFSSLVGTWKNGKGDVCIINSDGTTNRGETLTLIKERNSESFLFPFVELRWSLWCRSCNT